MRKVQCNSRSENRSGGESKNPTAKTNLGWEIEDTFACRKEIYRINEDLINIANKQISLADVFNSYKIHFDSVYSPGGWTQRRSCPFPDHNDSDPSFNYNPEENRFYCFGCKRGGQAVQFVATIEGLSHIVAAERILDKFESLEDVFLNLRDQKSEEIDKLLLEFAEHIHHFILNNATVEAREFMEGITWGLDLYLHKHVPRSSLDVDNLRARLQLLTKKLDKYV